MVLAVRDDRAKHETCATPSANRKVGAGGNVPVTPRVGVVPGTTKPVVGHDVLRALKASTRDVLVNVLVFQLRPAPIAGARTYWVF
jgi:hypothetical protein